MICFHRTLLTVSMISFAGGITTAADRTGQSLRFEFGALATTARKTVVQPNDFYTSARGYGFEPGPGVRKLGSDQRQPSIVGDLPFLFSAKVPEGNYRVTVTLGDATAVGLEDDVGARHELRGQRGRDGRCRMRDETARGSRVGRLPGDVVDLEPARRVETRGAPIRTNGV